MVLIQLRRVSLGAQKEVRCINLPISFSLWSLLAPQSLWDTIIIIHVPKDRIILQLITLLLLLPVPRLEFTDIFQNVIILPSLLLPFHM